MQVSAKRKNGDPVTVEANIGDNLGALVSQYGEDVVFNHAKGSLIVSLQGFIRVQLDAKKSQEEIQKAVDEWKPGSRKQGKTPAEKIRDQLSKLSPEARAALLKEYRNAHKGAAA